MGVKHFGRKSDTPGVGLQRLLYPLTQKLNMPPWGETLETYLELYKPPEPHPPEPAAPEPSPVGDEFENMLAVVREASKDIYYESSDHQEERSCQSVLAEQFEKGAARLRRQYGPDHEVVKSLAVASERLAEKLRAGACGPADVWPIHKDWLEYLRKEYAEFSFWRKGLLWTAYYFGRSVAQLRQVAILLIILLGAIAAVVAILFAFWCAIVLPLQTIAVLLVAAVIWFIYSRVTG